MTASRVILQLEKGDGGKGIQKEKETSLEETNYFASSFYIIVPPC